MLPKEHVVYGFIFAFLLQLTVFPTFEIIAGTLIFLASVFIDVDHYLSYVWKKGNLSLRKAYYYFKNEEYKKGRPKRSRGPLMIFHTIEFVAVLFYLTTFNKYFMFIIIGILFHWLLDFYYMYKHHVLYERTYSLIHHLMTRNKSF